MVVEVLGLEVQSLAEDRGRPAWDDIADARRRSVARPLVL
jgi:hypothetical protein